MKKMMIIALALAFSGLGTEAVHAAVSVRVPVLCKADKADDVYIAKMEALDDTLLETIREGLLYLKDTQSGDFVMEFTEPGNYHYRVLQDGEESSGNNFDSTVYAVDVYVSRNEDGMLIAEPVVYEINGDKKETAIRFLNMPREYYERETESETQEPETEAPGEKEGAKTPPAAGSGRRGSASGSGGTSVRTLDSTPTALFELLFIFSGAAAAAVFHSLMKRLRKGRCGQ